jgi:Ca2+/H+ antiporter
MEVNIVQELPRQLVTHENFIKYELIVRDSESHHTHTSHTHNTTCRNWKVWKRVIRTLLHVVFSVATNAVLSLAENLGLECP